MINHNLGWCNCHFELNIQYWQTTWHLRQANHKPCIYTSRSIWALSLVFWSHSFKLHKVKTNLRRVYDLLTIFNFLILWKHAILTYHVAKKMIASRSTVFGISCSPSPFLIALATGRSGISSPDQTRAVFSSMCYWNRKCCVKLRFGGLLASWERWTVVDFFMIWPQFGGRACWRSSFDCWARVLA